MVLATGSTKISAHFKSGFIEGQWGQLLSFFLTRKGGTCASYTFILVINLIVHAPEVLLSVDLSIYRFVDIRSQRWLGCLAASWQM